jgi:hypothetical protein
MTTAHALNRARFRQAALLCLPLVAAALVWLWPATSRAEASFATGPTAKASASIHFRVVIPPVMRVLENSHPAQLQPSADGSALTAEQRLVVVSNMKHGFCVALRQPTPELATGWQLQQAPSEGGGAVLISPVADGYRLCASRPGRYTLRLQHAFPPATAEQLARATALHWPVQTDLTAL